MPRSTRTHVEKIQVHIPPQKPHQQHEKSANDKSPFDKDLPKAPNPGGLGLFVATPVVEQPPPASAPIPIFAPAPPPPPPNPARRPVGVRRATVSECQRLPTPEAENDQFIEQEHLRQDQMWEEEQQQRQKEIEEERRKYAEGRIRSAAAQHERKKSVESLATPPPDSPVMNEHGIPSPPPTMSPPTKALKRSISTKDDRKQWREEIREQMRRQEEAQAAKDREVQAEQERLRKENTRRDRARQEAEADRVRRQQQHSLPTPPPRIYPEPAYPKAKLPAVSKRDQDSKRQLRARRRGGQKDSGYLSSGRSADGYGRAAATTTTAQNWRWTKPKRYYGEGTTDLRDEGMDGQRVQEDEEWLDLEPLPPSPAETPSFMKAAWTLYETGWKRLFDTPPEVNSLRFAEIPWPSLEPLPITTNPRSPKGKTAAALPPTALQISAVLNQRSISKFLLSPHHSEGKSSRTRLRAALLRFHPDKVARWVNLIQESERDAVVMGVEIVVRCLNELMRNASDEVVA